MSRSGDPAIFATTTDRPTDRQTKLIALPLAQACGGNNRKRVGWDALGVMLNVYKYLLTCC